MSDFYLIKCTKSFLINIGDKDEELQIIFENGVGKFIINGDENKIFHFNITNLSENLHKISSISDIKKIDINNSKPILNCIKIHGNHESFEIAKTDIIKEENLKFKRKEQVKSNTISIDKLINCQRRSRQSKRQEITVDIKIAPTKICKPRKTPIVTVVKSKNEVSNEKRLGRYNAKPMDISNQNNQLLERYRILHSKHYKSICVRNQLETSFRCAIRDEDTGAFEEISSQINQFFSGFSRQSLREYQTMAKIRKQLQGKFEGNC